MTPNKDEQGIRRSLRRVERRFPGRFARFLRWLRRPGSQRGIAGFQLFVGLLLLAQDLPLLRRPMRRLLVCSERRWRKHQWHRRRRRDDGVDG